MLILLIKELNAQPLQSWIVVTKVSLLWELMLFLLGGGTEEKSPSHFLGVCGECHLLIADKFGLVYPLLSLSQGYD